MERDTLNNIPAEQAANFNSHAHVERDYERLRDALSLNISTHTLTWSVTIAEFVVFRIIHISTHTLTWSVTRQWIFTPIVTTISTHTLTWSVTFGGMTGNDNTVHFNSHAHVERDQMIGSVWSRVLHFNSHAHVERDLTCHKLVVCPEVISTHTLTWSVTQFKECMTESRMISTHTLTWSVTLQFCAKCGRWWISTHTLTWSVTCCLKNTFCYGLYFNSHAHVERDSRTFCRRSI